MVVWLTGVAAYIVAILHRSSLGAVGIEAAQHFGQPVATISMFAMIQVLVYAVAQIPAGLLLDRFGSRWLLICGSLVMSVGQLAIALTASLPVAIAARTLIGIGDAAMFSSVLRLIPFWFSEAKVPVLSQITGLSGQLGQLMSVGLLLPLLHLTSWQSAFLAAASTSVISAVAVYLAVQDAPPGQSPERTSDHLADMPSQIRQMWRHEATQLGFWVHFTSGFSLNSFLMIWGIPFLVVAEGTTQQEAATMIGIATVAIIGVALWMGYLTARHPLRRSNLALTAIGIGFSAWVVVLAWPGPAPLWVLGGLCLAVMIGGPATAVGIDYPRTLLPRQRFGVASAIVVSGAFIGATVAIGLIAIVVHVLSDGGAATPQSLTWAMAAQLPLYLAGTAMLLRARTKLRRRMAAFGVIVPKWSEVLRRLRAAHRR